MNFSRTLELVDIKLFQIIVSYYTIQPICFMQDFQFEFRRENWVMAIIDAPFKVDFQANQLLGPKRLCNWLLDRLLDRSLDR